MRAADLVRMLLLAALWGGSFVFMRVLSPVLGVVIASDARLLSAGLVLVAWFAMTRIDTEWRQRWRLYLAQGMISSAVPFLLYSYAALHIPASLSAILNSTSPLTGCIISVLWLGDRLRARQWFGIVLGMGGVALIANPSTIGSVDASIIPAVIAGIMAAGFYGFSAVFARRYSQGVKPAALAAWSQLLAGIALLPLVPFSPPLGEVTPYIVALTIAYGVLCSAFAYLLYFRLIVDVGATRTMMVSFMSPVFGVLFGVVLLGEALSPMMVGGGVIILIGLALALRR
jgi:drug/metabolite transporter (DMT)-like permease